MKVSIERLKVGTKFNYNGMEYVITSEDEYPFMAARCLTEPNEYEGLELLFTNFEQVEVPDDTILAKRYYSITDMRTGETVIKEMQYK